MAAPALLMLGACNLSGDDAGQAEQPSDAQILERAGQLEQPVPGLYRSITRMTAYELPGAPPEEARLARERMAAVAPQESQHCLSAEEAKRGFGAMLQTVQGGECRFDSFTTTGAKMSAVMRCAAADGGSSVITMDGVGRSTESSMELVIEQQGLSIPGGTASIRMTVENRRVGDC
ncbi:DUF3617 family protein [Altererythrobacter xixiisoli]|uniref:DUF3617 family protein n=2 Tax=Croceibacterium xixiisoli TaxID=1476466 RepID=A0A6I4TY22_9SPHN|nr:DUF3617 family protein [Croceibacterium xixiisoli]